MPNTPGATLVGSPIEISNQTDTPIARANQVEVDAAGFSGNLSPTDINVQIALETIDAMSGGVNDGNKGDITVSGSGSTWSINSGAVSIDDLDEDLRAFIVAMAVSL